MTIGPTKRPKRSTAGSGQGAPELETAVGLWLRLAQQQDLRLFNERFADEGVSQVLFSILLAVAADPGCRQADLGLLLRIRQPNLVEPIETLLERGLISRHPDPLDRRAQTLALTPRGEGLLERLKTIHEDLIGRYRSGIGEANYRQLIVLLRQFIAATGAADKPG